jgi:hypothetical protein
VFQQALATGTWKGPWLDRMPPTGGRQFDRIVLIFFPYDAARGLFTGEVVYGSPLDGVAQL